MRHPLLQIFSSCLLMANVHVTFSFIAVLPTLRQSTIVIQQQQQRQRQQYHPRVPQLILRGSTSTQQDQQVPLCDLQTLLRLAECLDTGGSAKVAIQSGACTLNGTLETRRAKKLFPGDIVVYQGTKEINVDQVVSDKNYVYKPKVKKIKPQAKVDEFGNKEFGGQYRSEEWRAERKMKKAERKSQNASEKE
mmetsp:Transcript_22637/g.31604  ORF Transcript_22637/g.31604 Transcript_22637/m.31604 type:complete len:192 (-) Transcript_22637:191-766(-)